MSGVKLHKQMVRIFFSIWRRGFVKALEQVDYREKFNRHGQEQLNR